MIRTEYEPLDDLVADPTNPKEHADENIVASIQRFGFAEPIVLDERTGRILSGHGRANVLRILRDAGAHPPAGISVDPDSGEWVVPVVRGWSSTSDEEARLAVIALNRTVELGGWNESRLLETLSEFDDLTGVGYGEEDIEALRIRLQAWTDDDVPTFLPLGEDAAARLDKRKPTTCPSCGTRFDATTGEPL